MNSTAFVITCNDSVQHVVRGTQEQAEVKLEELREDYFQRNRWVFGETEAKQRDAFRLRCHWAARETPFEDLS